MYRWKIDLILKSGKELTVYYESRTAKNSRIAAEEILNDDCLFVGFMNENDTQNILVNQDEIATFSISFA